MGTACIVKAYNVYEHLFKLSFEKPFKTCSRYGTKLGVNFMIPVWDLTVIVN